VGELELPASGTVYLDANGFIYSVEHIDPYWTVLNGLWKAVSAGQVSVVTSELTLLEVLVKPLKVGDTAIAETFRKVLRSTPEVQMLPITQNVLEKAANLRATMSLKTPDALHTATALLNDCTLFMTNDSVFRRVTGLRVAVLSEVVPS
jgi:predicted nucleic acid-binding protein